MGRSSAIWVMGSGWVRHFTKPILVAIGPWAAMGLVYLWAGVFFRFRGMFTGFEFLGVFFVSMWTCRVILYLYASCIDVVSGIGQ